MVSTRGGARTGPVTQAGPKEDDVPSLKKKPVRKATAKPAQTTTKSAATTITTTRPATKPATKPATNPAATSAPKTRTTRSKAPDKEAEEQDQKSSATAPAVEPAKPAKRTTTRSTQLEPPAPARNEPVKVEEKKSSKPATAKKADVKVDKVAKVDEKRLEPKSTVPSRPTRHTRAASPVTSPLSPKKITQVSRARGRANNVVEEKKPTQRKTPVDMVGQRGRVGTKSRAISDENEDVPEPEVLTVMHVRIPDVVKDTSLGALGGTQDEVKVPKDNKPATPKSSVAPLFIAEQNLYVEERPSSSLRSPAVQMPNHTHSEPASEDELCGPKTPMRRPDANAEARYQASVQKTIDRTSQVDPDVPVDTPPRRHVLRGVNRGTPQTTKPTQRAAVPSSQTRSMTVTRSSRRNNIPIRPLSDARSPIQAVSDNENDLETGGVSTDEEKTSSGKHAQKSTKSRRSSSATSHDKVLKDAANDEENPQVDSDFDMLSETETDPNETIIVNHEEIAPSGDRNIAPEDNDEESENSVLFTPYNHNANAADLTEDMDDEELAPLDETLSFGPLKTPRPETIQWENLREDVTIPVDFDLHFADVRSPEGLQHAFTMPAPFETATEEAVAYPEINAMETSDIRDATVNFDEFFDVAALADSPVTPGLNQTKLSTSVGSDTKMTGHGASSDASPLPYPNFVALNDSKDGRSQENEEDQVPHYALPTFAFDVRRKSLPNFGHCTPARSGARPSTSDGASMPRLANGFGTPWPVATKDTNPDTPISTPIRARRSSVRGTAQSRQTPGSVAKTGTPSPVTVQPATPKERFPRLAPRQNYMQHATTVAGPSRSRTPSKSPAKQPATVQRPADLRRIALKASTPLKIHTPIKTPLKPPGMTPGQEPLTPHPAAPLREITALVEVFTLEGASASTPFVALLHRLGAKTSRSWSDRITHVVFKDGSPTTLQRVRLHNKDVDERSAGVHILCVNSRWVTDCDYNGRRVDESDEAYAVDVADVPRGGKRRRKSMEPSALVNVGGNIVRNRKSSLGGSSLRRQPLDFDSPAMKPGVDAEVTPLAKLAGKENYEEEGSPVTPDWIAAPEKLVQATAPINRVRKLDFKAARDKAKDRRLTFWNGAS